MTALEEAAQKALMIGIQTGTGEMFHQDAQALILLAFSDADSAVAFQEAYLKVKEDIHEARIC